MAQSHLFKIGSWWQFSFIFPFWDKVLLYSFGWPGTCYADQTGFGLTACPCLPKAGIKGMSHQTRLTTAFLSLLEKFIDVGGVCICVCLMGLYVRVMCAYLHMWWYACVCTCSAVYAYIVDMICEYVYGSLYVYICVCVWVMYVCVCVWCFWAHTWQCIDFMMIAFNLFEISVCVCVCEDLIDNFSLFLIICRVMTHMCQSHLRL